MAICVSRYEQTIYSVQSIYLIICKFPVELQISEL